MTLHLRPMPDEARHAKRDRSVDTLTKAVDEARSLIDQERRAIASANYEYERDEARLRIMRDDKIAACRHKIAENTEMLAALEPARAKLMEGAA